MPPSLESTKTVIWKSRTEPERPGRKPGRIPEKEKAVLAWGHIRVRASRWRADLASHC